MSQNSLNNSMQFISTERFQRNTSKDKFFDDLSRKGDKNDRIKKLEQVKLRNDLKDCTFKPILSS